MSIPSKSIMQGREPENWDWFMDPVDIILSRLYVRDLAGARANIREFVDYLEDAWQAWGVMLGTFAVVMAAGLDDEAREEMKVFAMTLPQEPRGIDGQLFDTLVAMEWITEDPELSVGVEPFPMDNKYVYFTAMFCLLAGLFSVLELPDDATPSLTMITVFQKSAAA